MIPVQEVTETRKRVREVLTKFKSGELNQVVAEDSIVSMLLAFMIDFERRHSNVDYGKIPVDYKKLAEALIGNNKMLNVSKRLSERKEHDESLLSMVVESVELQDMATIEKNQVIKALVTFKHNRKLAANSLGMSERTLYRKINEYNLTQQ